MEDARRQLKAEQESRCGCVLWHSAMRDPASALQMGMCVCIPLPWELLLLPGS